MSVARTRISLSSSASKRLETIEPHKVRERIEKRISGLIDNPIPTGAKKLAGPPKTFRLRQGEYRVVYQLQDSKIVVLKIGHRREVYR